MLPGPENLDVKQGADYEFDFCRPLSPSLCLGAVQRIFIFEGMVIGMLSLIIAILLALTPGIIVGNISGGSL